MARTLARCTRESRDRGAERDLGSTGCATVRPGPTAPGGAGGRQRIWSWSLQVVRIAWGYNAFGFTGRDRAALGYTQHGAYLDLGVKFHEWLFGQER
jgi:hypothetical protein